MSFETTISKEIPINDRYRVFLRLFSVYYDLHITEREIDVLHAFWLTQKGLINYESRHSVANELGITQFNLTNYLLKLRKRKIVTDDGLHSSIMIDTRPSDKSFQVIFKLTQPLNAGKKAESQV
jgi:hypothetical protein